MRPKIEVNEYKDYILGFIFYKYLSDQLPRFAKQQGMAEAEIQAVSEEDAQAVDYIKKSRLSQARGLKLVMFRCDQC